MNIGWIILAVLYIILWGLETWKHRKTLGVLDDTLTMNDDLMKDLQDAHHQLRVRNQIIHDVTSEDMSGLVIMDRAEIDLAGMSDAEIGMKILDAVKEMRTQNDDS